MHPKQIINNARLGDVNVSFYRIMLEIKLTLASHCLINWLILCSVWPVMTTLYPAFPILLIVTQYQSKVTYGVT